MRHNGYMLARLLMALSIPLAAAAQIELNPPRPRATISVDVNLVNVLCSVRDKNGGYVTDLPKDAFTIREDGKEQPITHFARQVDTPVTVALLLDVSGSVTSVLGEEKAAAKRFFAEVMRPGDRAMLVGFAQLIDVWQDLALSPDVLNQALDEKAGPFEITAAQVLETTPRGGTLLYDAIDLVASQKLMRLPGRKAIVLITDGLDNGSKVDLDKASRAAQEADAVVYSIYYQDEVGAAIRSGLGPLSRLSETTGGRAFHVDQKTTLDQIFNAITEELRNQYALGYPPPGSPKPGAYHKLAVKLARPGLKVQARAGYYSAPR